MTTFDTLDTKFDATTEQTRPVPLTLAELELVCGGSSPKGGWAAPEDASSSPKGGWL